jgi:hypothetical protein
MTAKTYLIMIVSRFPIKTVRRFIKKFQNRFLKKGHSGFAMEAIISHTDTQIKKLLITTLLNCALEL